MVDKQLAFRYNHLNGGERMEEILKMILKEVKGVKDELRVEMQEMKQELRAEMQEMKQELRAEMQEMKTELKDEINSKINQQSKEIAHELNEVVIFLEKRDDRIEAKLDKALEVQSEMKKDIRKIETKYKEHEYRISKLEDVQEELVS